MRSTTLALFFIATFANVRSSSASVITGATLFSATSQGNYLGEVWNTVGNDLVFNLYLWDGVTPLNSGNGAGTQINIPLNTAGMYTFIFRAQPGLLTPGQFGLNLFFNGNTSTPGISALVTAESSSFAANGAPLTPRLDGLPIVAGANSLVFVDGDFRISLTALSESRTGGNQVAAYSNAPGLVGGNDYVGGFTLTVATPEPSSLVLFGSAVGLALFRRRR
jgi:hypothetical protein